MEFLRDPWHLGFKSVPRASRQRPCFQRLGRAGGRPLLGRQARWLRSCIVTVGDRPWAERASRSRRCLLVTVTRCAPCATWTAVLRWIIGTPLLARPHWGLVEPSARNRPTQYVRLCRGLRFELGKNCCRGFLGDPGGSPIWCQTPKLALGGSPVVDRVPVLGKASGTAALVAGCACLCFGSAFCWLRLCCPATQQSRRGSNLMNLTAPPSATNAGRGSRRACREARRDQPRVRRSVAERRVPVLRGREVYQVRPRRDC